MRRRTSAQLACGLRFLVWMVGAWAWVCVPGGASREPPSRLGRCRSAPRSAPSPARPPFQALRSPRMASRRAGDRRDHGRPDVAAGCAVDRGAGAAGVQVMVLGPQPEPVPQGEAARGPRFGLRVGTTYWLALINLPGRPGAALCDGRAIGHPHRPAEIDPGRFPVRVALRQDDLDDVLVRGRLVTHVVYLEDPEQALPLAIPKDELPLVVISPAENPLKVAPLGRPMVLVKVAAACPTPTSGTAPPRVPWPWARVRSPAPRAPTAGCPADHAADHPPPRKGAPGCRVTNTSATAATTVSPPVSEPRTACAASTRATPSSSSRLRTAFASCPRTSSVSMLRGSPTWATAWAPAKPHDHRNPHLDPPQRDFTEETTQVARRFTQNNTAEAFRHHTRLSSLGGRVIPFEHAEVRILQGYEDVTSLAGNITIQGTQTAAARQKASFARTSILAVQIRTAESAVVTGIVQGASTAVMAWKPRRRHRRGGTPQAPGMAVIERVSADTAEPGDVVTFSIQFRTWAIPQSCRCPSSTASCRASNTCPPAPRVPKGTVFSAGPNSAGSTELRWDLQSAR